MAACEPHSCAESPESSGLGKVQIASSIGEGSLVASSSQLGNQQEPRGLQEARHLLKITGNVLCAGQAEFGVSL